MPNCIWLAIRAHELIQQASRTDVCLQDMRELLTAIEQQTDKVKYALSGYSKQLRRCLILASPERR